MDHDAIRQMLSAYLDKAVSPAERSLIEKHLAECGECRNTLRELERTVSQVRNLGEMEPPPWLTARVMARVREQAGRESGVLRRILQLLLRWSVPLEAAALLFVTVTGYLVYRNVSSDVKQVVPLSGEVRREAAVPAPVAPQGVPARDSAAESAANHKKPQPIRKEKGEAPPVTTAPSAGRYLPSPSVGAPAAADFAEAPPRAEEKHFEQLPMAEPERARPISPSTGLAREGTSRSDTLRSKSLDINGIEELKVVLSVENADLVVQEIERETKRYGGEVLHRDAEQDGARVIVVRMQRSAVGAYLERLERMGSLSGQTSIAPGGGLVDLRLTVTGGR